MTVGDGSLGPVKDDPHYDECPDWQSSIFWSRVLNRSVCNHCGDYARPKHKNEKIHKLKTELAQLIAQTEWRQQNGR